MVILVDAAKIFDNLNTYLPLESSNKTRNKIKLKFDKEYLLEIYKKLHT